ncbi:MAG: hypothetical protein CL794_00370 [Chloroflexi bacterium]|nr:hypothetical protein [Chloroflexota bacterium]
MFHSLQWRIAFFYTLLIFSTMGIVSLFLFNYIQRSYLTQVYNHLEREAMLISEAAAVNGFEANLNSLISGISNVLARANHGQEYRIAIFDGVGNIILDTESSIGNHWGTEYAVQYVSTGEGYRGKVKLTDGEELFSIESIQIGGRSVGAVIVSVPSEKVEGYINLIVATVVISGVIVGGLSITLSIYIARRTSRSIVALTMGAARIQGGDLSHRVRSHVNDETSDLADAFNKMANTIAWTVDNLSTERDTLSAVLDTMADGVISVDREGSVTVFNQTAGELLNVSPKNAIGMRLAEVIRDFEILQLASRCENSGALLHSEVEVPEVRRFLSVTATPLGFDAERGVLLTVHDLTHIRQTETSRKEFVSNVSHELRSPIASIRAMAETLEDGAIGDKKVAQDFIGRILRDIQRMTVMVDDLLELSRIESGQEVIDIHPVNLFRIANESISYVKGEINDGMPEIILNVTEEIMVMGQEEKISQVFVNLIQNASRFTRQNGLITITAKQYDNDIVEVSVSDTGMGIAPEHLAHVFERFYKVDRSRRDGGTGLGLSIVKHLVQAQGGEVFVDSVEGEGSTFKFTLPVA